MHFKHALKQLLIVSFSSLLVACAATETDPGEDNFVAERRGSDCISQSSVRDYRVLDEANLIVSAGARQKYHVVLARRAYGLRSTWQIGFRSTTGRICGGFDDLIVDGGFGPEPFRIHSIRRLTPEEEDELLVRFGKKEPSVKQAPATEDPESAEVEELD
ncbi:MAG: DUF6491 family protein [Woeseiaceae bacterium]|nr:DUF6491 family protein [Woeseiaceae bacterium]